MLKNRQESRSQKLDRSLKKLTKSKTEKSDSYRIKYLFTLTTIKNLAKNMIAYICSIMSCPKFVTNNDNKQKEKHAVFVSNSILMMELFVYASTVDT